LRLKKACTRFIIFHETRSNICKNNRTPLVVAFVESRRVNSPNGTRLSKYVSRYVMELSRYTASFIRWRRWWNSEDSDK